MINRKCYNSFSYFFYKMTDKNIIKKRLQAYYLQV